VVEEHMTLRANLGSTFIYWGHLLLQVACAGAGGLALPHP
jgi:hypothetical protein